MVVQNITVLRSGSSPKGAIEGHVIKPASVKEQKIMDNPVNNGSYKW